MAIGRAMMKLARDDSDQAAERETAFGRWLCEQNQSKNAVDHFWSVIVQGALAETVENASLSAVKKVFVDGFLASRSAGEMILPRMPLGEIFDGRVGNHLAERGVKLHRRRRVMWIEAGENSELSIVLAEGETRTYDAIVLAVPWHQAEGLFPPELLEELPELKNAQKLQPGGITAVHLWFDRPLTELPHAVLVGKLSQWIFRCASKGKGEGDNSDLAYYQVVISAAHRLAVMEKEAMLDRVLAELAEAFPDFASAKLLHSRVVQQPQAVFAMLPGVEIYRPGQKTSIDNLFLTGDWTATGWPSTMEGAVRSGYLATEALLESVGRPHKILVPDLPRGLVARKLLGK
jgi:squalene-associated FAD-dependent desaturase